MSEPKRLPIEVDITYTNKSWWKPVKGKTAPPKDYVIGFFARKGKCCIKVLENNSPENIHKAVVESVGQGNTLYCHENLLPDSLKELYDIQELKTSDGHAKGDIHVNNVNNLWKDLKRRIKMTHVSVSKKHLQGYCNEVMFHANNLDLTPMEKFNKMLANSAGTLTYDQLKSR